jgi:hypothetical protein
MTQPTAAQHAAATPAKAFKPYGSPPPFYLEAECDIFPVWLEGGTYL